MDTIGESKIFYPQRLCPGDVFYSFLYFDIIVLFISCKIFTVHCNRSVLKVLLKINLPTHLVQLQFYIVCFVV